MSFSAAPSALGYYYQSRYALLLLLKADDDAQMSIVAQKVIPIEYKNGRGLV